jgi:hypothetical protein
MSADLLTQVSQYVDVTDKSFLLAAGFILFNPTFWNVVGRFEHKTRLIRKAFCGHKLAAVYFFAVVIFSLGIARDLVYPFQPQTISEIFLLPMSPFPLQRRLFPRCFFVLFGESPILPLALGADTGCRIFCPTPYFNISCAIFSAIGDRCATWSLSLAFCGSSGV